MKYAVISDIHANLPALNAVLQAIAAQGADRIVCLSDITGYHTEPAACVQRLREADALCVVGNHDRAVIGAIPPVGLSPEAQRAVVWTRERLQDDVREFLATLPLKRAIDGVLVAVHGALHPDTGCEWVRLDDDPKRALSLDALALHPSGARVCAFGHTHRPGVWERRADGAIRRVRGTTVTLCPDAWYLVNPGSVGEPRDQDLRASFLMLDACTGSVRFLRVPYDRPSVMARTRAAGLLPPPRLPWLPPRLRAWLGQWLRRCGVHGLALGVLQALDRPVRTGARGPK